MIRHTPFRWVPLTFLLIGSIAACSEQPAASASPRLFPSPAALRIAHPDQRGNGKRAGARAVRAACRAATTGRRRAGFGQDPRWRRALVDAVAPPPGERDPRRRDRHGHGRGGAACAATDVTVVGLDQSPQMLGAARARASRATRLARASSSSRGRPSGCRSPTASSTT